jgi:hypothetical protein
LTVTTDCPDGIAAGSSGTVTVTVTDADMMDVTASATFTYTASNDTITITVAGVDSNSGSIDVPEGAEVGSTFTLSAVGTVEGQSAAGECTITINEQVACKTDADCADDDDCTTDACGDSGCTNTAVECADGEECLAGVCTPTCTDDADCDDGDACNGAETCGDDGLCADGEAVNCDDGDACTEGTCNSDDGTCDQADVDCDDGLDCTDDDCDMTDGCSNTSTCADGEMCTADGCVECETDADCDDGQTCEAGVCLGDCETDADCDDGTFCNGTETCNTETGSCVGGEDPCAATECECDGEIQDPVCQEGDDSADCSCEECPGIDLTLAQDNVSASTGNDVINGPLEFNAGTGLQVATLQTGDSVNGLAGVDDLFSSHNGTGLVPTISGVENHYLTVFAATTMTGTNITGIDLISSSASTASLTVTNMQEATDIGMQNVTDGTSDLSITFATAATSGSSDTIGMNLEGATSDFFTITTAANGFETATLNSLGGTKNTLNNIAQATGTTMASLTITGPAEVEVKRIPGTVLDVDATGAAAGCTLGTGDGSATNAFAAFHAANVNVNNLTGGPGPDWFVFGTTYDGNDAADSGESISGGDGSDNFQATLSGTIGSVLAIDTVENVYFNATATSSVNCTGVTGIENVNITADGASTGITLLNISGTTLPTLNFMGSGAVAAQISDGITYQSSGTGGSGDELAVTVGNRGTAMNTTGTTNAHTIGALVAPAIETLGVTCSDGPCTITTGITASTGTTFNFTGDSNVTCNALTTGGTDSITGLTASGVTGDFAGNCADFATGASLTFGPGNDTFTTADSGSTSSVVSLGSGNDTYVSSDTDSADVVTGGDGTDSITPGGGLDTVTGGGSADTHVFVATSATAADLNTITDFTAGAGGDIASLDVSAVAAGIVAALSSGNFSNGTAAAVAAADNTFLVINDTSYANFAAAELVIQGLNAATLDYCLVFLNSTSGVAEVWVDEDSSAAGAGIQIASFSNITTLAGVAALVATNFNSF